MTQPFELFFGGADQPLSAEMLWNEGVTHQVVSFYEWVKRHGNDTELEDHFHPNIKLCVTPGVAKRPALNWATFIRQYSEFVLDNAERLSLALEIDNEHCPQKERLELRFLLSELGEKLVVFRTDDAQLPFLEHYRIGLNSQTARQIKSWAGKYKVHLVNSTSEKLILSTGAQSASTYAWLSPRRYGEAWVWDGKLVHYPAAEIAALAGHRAAVEALEVSYEAAQAGDQEALLILAIRSLQRFSADVAAKAAKKPTPVPMVPRDTEGAAAHPSRAKAQPVERIPVMASDEPFKFSPVQLRSCDSCYLAGKCPKYEPSSSCGYEIPVEIKTRDDWKKACRALIELQYQRVTFSALAEQVDGAPQGERTGREMDRFMKMLRELQALEQNDVEEVRSGVLTEIFGATLSDINALPVRTDET
jgi:hypothetical protein